ncbi:MAG: hypothetical protein ICV83_21525 [Cytophagales bacterium]|nr:hypothetical protein [Cytophagales bacterium]
MPDRYIVRKRQRPAWPWALGVLALLALLAWFLRHPGTGEAPGESDEPPAKPRGVYVHRPSGPGVETIRAA